MRFMDLLDPSYINELDAVASLGDAVQYLSLTAGTKVARNTIFILTFEFQMLSKVEYAM